MRREKNRNRNYGGRYSRGSQNHSSQPQIRGSARSDYGEHAYGGRLDDEGMENQGWCDRAGSEISSWFEGESDDYEEQRERNYENRDLQFYLHHPSAYPVGMNPYSYAPQKNQKRRENWREMRAGEIMTQNAATVFPNDSVQYAARLMRDEDCGAIPVVNRKGQLVGMVTDRDITVRLVASGYDASRALVSDCMTREAFACHFSETLRDCMSVMSRHQIRRLPVVDDSKRVVGIISQADLARCADESRNRRGKRAFTDLIEDISEPTSGAYS